MKPCKGDYVIVHVREHDCWDAAFEVRRVVKTRRDGYITHVVSPRAWHAAIKANAGNTLDYQFITVCSATVHGVAGNVFRLGPYARRAEVERLDGERWATLDRAAHAVKTICEGQPSAMAVVHAQAA